MKKFKSLFTVLFLGGLWGLLEATLGTLLHLEVFDSVIFASTAVLLPIAYLIMGAAYKETGKASSILYVGLVAASIKAVCFLFVPAINKVINPMVAIVLEAAFGTVAYKVTSPNKVVSLKSFVTFMLFSTALRATYVGYSMLTAPVFKSAYIVDGEVIWSQIVEYVITMNAISFAYLAIFMAAGFGFKLLQSANGGKVLANIKRLAYTPVFALFMVCAALVSTIFLK